MQHLSSGVRTRPRLAGRFRCGYEVEHGGVLVRCRGDRGDSPRSVQVALLSATPTARSAIQLWIPSPFNKGICGNAGQRILLRLGFDKVYNLAGANNHQTQQRSTLRS